MARSIESFVLLCFQFHIQCIQICHIRASYHHASKFPVSSQLSLSNCNLFSMFGSSENHTSPQSYLLQDGNFPVSCFHQAFPIHPQAAMCKILSTVSSPMTILDCAGYGGSPTPERNHHIVETGHSASQTSPPTPASHAMLLKFDHWCSFMWAHGPWGKSCGHPNEASGWKLPS